MDDKQLFGTMMGQYFRIAIEYECVPFASVQFVRALHGSKLRFAYSHAPDACVAGSYGTRYSV